MLAAWLHQALEAEPKRLLAILQNIGLNCLVNGECHLIALYRLSAHHFQHVHRIVSGFAVKWSRDLRGDNISAMNAGQVRSIDNNIDFPLHILIHLNPQRRLSVGLNMKTDICTDCTWPIFQYFQISTSDSVCLTSIDRPDLDAMVSDGIGDGGNGFNPYSFNISTPSTHRATSGQKKAGGLLK